MSDEQNSGTGIPQATPAPSGALDWLLESHQQSAPMAPLTDELPPPAHAPLTFGLPDPATRPAAAHAFPDLLAEPSAEPPAAASIFAPPAASAEAPVESVAPPPVVLPQAGAAQPVASAQDAAALAMPVWSPPPASPAPGPVQVAVAPPVVPQPTAPTHAAPVAEVPAAEVPLAPMPTTPMPIARPPAAPSPASTTSAGVFSFTAEPLAPAAFDGGPGSSRFTLERHGGSPRSGNGPLDWAALVLAFLAPPIGLVTGIAAVVLDSRSKGYVAGIAKAAIAIGAALTIVLGAAFAVVTKISDGQAAHAAIVASSRAYCAKLTANPATLSSDTFGWPSPGNTIPESIKVMKAYETNWDSLAKLAPTGIRSDTAKVAAAAKSIVATVQSSQTLNDSGNVAQMQNVVATSGIHAWVSSYCS